MAKSRFTRDAEVKVADVKPEEVSVEETPATAIVDEKRSQFAAAIKAFSGYINAEYKSEKSKVHNLEDLDKIIVNDYVTMPDAFTEATELKGLPFGVLACCYGKPDTGKTTLLMEGIKGCIEDMVIPVLILTEHKFAYDRLQAMGVDLMPIVILVDNIEEGYDVLIKMMRDLQQNKLKFKDKDGKEQVIDMTKNKCYFFWDSIGNVMSQAEMESETEDWQKGMMKTAKALRVLTRKVSMLLNKVRDKTGVLFLNQSYISTTPQGIQIETPTGGDAIPYSSALVLRTRRRKRLDMELDGKDTDIGLETIIETVKNHITNRKLTASVFTVASGMIPATKEALDAYKKTLR
jgi:RecA/RadA recombinase